MTLFKMKTAETLGFPQKIQQAQKAAAHAARTVKS